MKFVLQEQSDRLDIDVQILKDILDERPYQHQYELCTVDDIKNSDMAQGAFPAGSIEFVLTWLKKYLGIKKMEPIEIPSCLQKDKFIKRDYRFIKGRKLPKEGQYFLKCVDRLKELSYCGEIASLWEEGRLNPDSLYLLENPVEFLSEWRVFIHRDTVVQCINYEGTPLLFPDRSRIEEMIHTLQSDTKHMYPRAYTLDVGVLEDYSTVLIEMHPWCCIGLYGYLFDTNLPYCYAEGLRWYIEWNTPKLFLKEQ